MMDVELRQCCLNKLVNVIFEINYDVGCGTFLMCYEETGHQGSGRSLESLSVNRRVVSVLLAQGRCPQYVKKTVALHKV
jgi:hypothetical protein